jgi:hypothetical protein
VDRVYESTRGRGPKKKTNPKPDGSKKDAKTAKPPPRFSNLGSKYGVNEDLNVSP